MPWILSKIISSETVAKEILFSRKTNSALDFLENNISLATVSEDIIFDKSKAELVLTNLKTFDTFVFHNYQK